MSLFDREEQAMAHTGLDVYLHDHLAGATLGAELAEQIGEYAKGTALAGVMAALQAEIEADRRTLLDVVERLDAGRHPVKQATGWLAEKASHVKFGGLSSGDEDHGLFMALESLALGVLGKRSLWVALREVRADHPQLADVDLDALILRAEAQYATLEPERLVAGRRALGADGG